MNDSLVKKCIRVANLKREAHRDTGGFGNRSSGMQSRMVMPKWLALQPEIMKLLCPEGADLHEQIKAQEYLEKKFPMLRSSEFRRKYI